MTWRTTAWSAVSPVIDILYYRSVVMDTYPGHEGVKGGGGGWVGRSRHSERALTRHYLGTV